MYNAYKLSTEDSIQLNKTNMEDSRINVYITGKVSTVDTIIVSYLL